MEGNDRPAMLQHRHAAMQKEFRSQAPYRWANKSSCNLPGIRTQNLLIAVLGGVGKIGSIIVFKPNITCDRFASRPLTESQNAVLAPHASTS